MSMELAYNHDGCKYLLEAVVANRVLVPIRMIFILVEVVCMLNIFCSVGWVSNIMKGKIWIGLD